MTLKEIRKKCKITQKQASEICNVSLRTYLMYENDETKVTSSKYKYLYNKLEELYLSDTFALKNKVLLITGGTGSFGNAMIRRLLDSDLREIRILSRDEKKQDDMRKFYHNPKLKFYIGDIRDYESIKDAFRGVDFVFHAAALKQVPSCEFFPMEAMKTNVIGSDNVIKACLEHHVKKAVFLSTDKACYPINVMGMTKALMEKNVIARSRTLLEGDTILCLTRYGNVMGSRGSVIPLFQEQIDNNQPITITNPNMTRFMMNLDEAVELVLYAFEHGKQGDLFVKKSPACSIETLAKAMLKLNNSNVPIEYIGTRHGEKLYETLVTTEEMSRCEDMGDFYCVHSDNRDLNYDLYFSIGNTEINHNQSYTSSNTALLDVDEMVELLKKVNK